MGLDQYWNVVYTNEHVIDPDEPAKTLHQHRKVPALQSFMADEWLKTDEGEGKSHDDFNCKGVNITEDMLDRLEAACHGDGKGLNKAATGFFFGRHFDEDIPDILVAINKARAELEAGNDVFYDSWW